MRLSEFVEKYGDCEVSEDLIKMVEKKKSGKWMPKDGEDYWFVNDMGNICLSKWLHEYYDIYRRDFSRIFKTKEECERYREIQKAFKEASFEPDWKDRNRKKFRFICIASNLESKLDIGYAITCCHPNCLYFESEIICRELIDQFGEKDILKYVFGIEE